MDLSRTDTEINGDFSHKSQIFSPLCILRPTRNWVSVLGVKKTRIMGLPGWIKSFDDIFSHLDTIHQRDTDGRRDTGRQQRPHLCIASRGNKEQYNAHTIMKKSCLWLYSKKDFKISWQMFSGTSLTVYFGCSTSSPDSADLSLSLSSAPSVSTLYSHHIKNT